MSGGYGGGTGAGEGPWYYSRPGGQLVIDVSAGDEFLLWASAGSGGGPTLAGAAATLEVVQGAGPVQYIYLITVTADGTLYVNEDGCEFGWLVAHKLLVPIIQG